MQVDLLILLSDVDGVYSGHPGDPRSRLITTYYTGQTHGVRFWSKSSVGRGGMESKVYRETISVYSIIVITCSSLV